MTSFGCHDDDYTTVWIYIYIYIWSIPIHNLNEWHLRALGILMHARIHSKATLYEKQLYLDRILWSSLIRQQFHAFQVMFYNGLKIHFMKLHTNVACVEKLIYLLNWTCRNYNINGSNQKKEGEYLNLTLNRQFIHVTVIGNNYRHKAKWGITAFIFYKMKEWERHVWQPKLHYFLTGKYISKCTSLK